MSNLETASLKVQEKIVDRLQNDQILSPILSDNIFNYQPNDLEYPSLFFKTLTEIDLSGDCMSLYQEFFLLHIVSEETDQEQIKYLARRVRKLLKDHDFTIADLLNDQGQIITKGQTIRINFEKTSFIFDDDSMTECVCEFNFIYTDNEV